MSTPTPRHPNYEYHAMSMNRHSRGQRVDKETTGATGETEEGVPQTSTTFVSPTSMDDSGLSMALYNDTSSESTVTEAMKIFNIFFVLYYAGALVLLIFSFFTLFGDSGLYISPLAWFIMYVTLAGLYGVTAVTYVIYYFVDRQKFTYLKDVRAYQTLMATINATLVYIFFAVIGYYIYNSVPTIHPAYPTIVNPTYVTFRVSISFMYIIYTTILGYFYMSIFLPDIVRYRK